MKRKCFCLGASAGLILLGLGSLATAQNASREALVVPFHCDSGDCLVLKGAPQTAGMRSGFVRLTTGKAVGWHTTGAHEETLVILHGSGEARIDGKPARTFTAPAIVYIPPFSRHNVVNTGKEMLEYVYVVAPIKAQ